MTLRPRPFHTVRPVSAAALAAAALVFLAGCGSGSDAGAAAPATAPAAAPATAGVGPATDAAVPAPMQFTAVAVDGSTVDGAALAAKPAVAWFWTPWCAICRSEAPEVAAMAEKYADRVNFVGIAGLGKVADMKRFVADTGVGGFAHAVDADGSIWRGFGVIGQPSFAFVHPDGTVEVVPGSLSPADLERRISGLTHA